jgi:hypothetical protein
LEASAGPALPVTERGHPDKQADAESRSDIKRIDHVHTICSDIYGYLMAPQFLPQCTLGNKNVSPAQQGWVVIFTHFASVERNRRSLRFGWKIITILCPLRGNEPAVRGYFPNAVL